MAKIIFSTQEVSFTLEFDDQITTNFKWCTCYVQHNNHVHKMGAEALHIIVDRFLKALSKTEQEIKETIKELNPGHKFGVCAFNEGYGSVSIDYTAGNVVLNFWDGGMNLICQTKLSGFEKEKWVKSFQELKGISSPSLK